MGTGYQFTCKKCGANYSVMLGIGILAPMDFREKLEDIRAGKYGSIWKSRLENNKYSGPDIEKRLYICGKCGAWKVEADMSLYAPDDADAKEAEYLLAVEQGTYESEENHVPFFMDKEQGYHLIEKYIHSCDKCGCAMKPYGKKIGKINCPECGKPNKYRALFNWD